MAFADPQSVTISGTAISMPRVYTGTSTGKFQSADGVTTLEISPKEGANSKSRQLKLKQTKITSDPLVTTTNVRVTDTITISIVRPINGFTDAEVVAQCVGVFSALTASSNALLTKLVAGEN